jgi:hypothetical protein
MIKLLIHLHCNNRMEKSIIGERHSASHLVSGVSVAAVAQQDFPATAETGRLVALLRRY